MTRNANFAAVSSLGAAEQAHSMAEAKANSGRGSWTAAALTTHDLAAKLTPLFEEVLEGFDERQIQILQSRTFRKSSPATLQSLGFDFHLTRERIRQIETDCVKQLAHRLEMAHFRPLVRASARISSAIGLAVPVRTAKAAGFLAGRVPGEAPQASFLRDFLMWLSGSYEIRDGWMIRYPAVQYIRRTQLLTHALLENGPISANRLVRALCAIGFRREIAVPWLSTFGQVRIFDSTAIRWDGNLADKAVAVMEHMREPMSKARLMNLLGSDRDVRTLANYLCKDERFEHVRRDLYGLKRWHGLSTVMPSIPTQ